MREKNTPGAFPVVWILYGICRSFDGKTRTAIFPKTYLDQLDLSKVSRTLLIEQSGSVDGQTVEDRLYQDIPMRDDSQQFFGGTGLDLEAVTEMVGGYDIAAVMAVVILLAAWLLIYNVLHISYGKRYPKIRSVEKHWEQPGNRSEASRTARYGKSRCWDVFGEVWQALRLP